jgi:puromycin-sensitive aminopeptidase
MHSLCLTHSCAFLPFHHHTEGASVVRMLRAFLGDHFFTGLKAYMAKFRYGNTETSDLWSAWEQVSGKPVTEVMKSWTEQMGYPVLSVSSAEWTPQELILKDVTQEWFLADGSKPEGFDDKLWCIPMILCVGNAEGKTLTIDVGLMKARTETIKVPLPAGFCAADSTGAGLWYKLNGEQHVPMRVQYPEADLAALAVAVQCKQMCTQDRAGLIQDASALAKAGRMDVGDLVELIGAYKNEDTLPVWYVLVPRWLFWLALTLLVAAATVAVVVCLSVVLFSEYVLQ